ncbi:MAG: zinc-finger domain-containing protein [Xanthomonadales bacterium]|nr:zinc-finger domain-containing protein [Xanthomonadales bacterium]
MSHKTDADNDQLGPANAENQYRVSPADLPLSCPTADMKLWNSHPRVYLPIEKTGRASCPYCGAEFILDETEAA